MPQLHNIYFLSKVILLNSQTLSLVKNNYLIIVRISTPSIIPVIYRWQLDSSDSPECCLLHHLLMILLKTNAQNG